MQAHSFNNSGALDNSLFDPKSHVLVWKDHIHTLPHKHYATCFLKHFLASFNAFSFQPPASTRTCNKRVSHHTTPHQCGVWLAGTVHTKIRRIPYSYMRNSDCIRIRNRMTVHEFWPTVYIRRIWIVFAGGAGFASQQQQSSSLFFVSFLFSRLFLLSSSFASLFYWCMYFH
jgi:hypothetical protein